MIGQTNRNLQLYIHRKLAEVAGLAGEFFFAFFTPGSLKICQPIRSSRLAEVYMEQFLRMLLFY